MKETTKIKWLYFPFQQALKKGFVAVLLCSQVFSAAFADPTLKQSFLVGFAQDTLANDWRLAQVKALEKEFAKYPNIDFVYTDGKDRTSRQIRDIEDLVAQGVDVLITSPRDGLAMAPVISRAFLSGIPVVLLTRGISGENYTTMIGPDDSEIARQAARYIIQNLGTSGRILMLQGLPGASTTQLRTSAFMEAIAEYPGFDVAIKVGNYLRSDAIRVVEEVLQEGIEFDAIYAQSDSMASGARIAMKKAGVDPRDKLIVGIDYISDARTAILEGEQAVSFTYSTSAREAVNVVLDILAGKEVPKRVYVDSCQVDISNVKYVTPIF